MTEFLNQENFVRMLGLERKRSERSGRRFVLMLLQSKLLYSSDGLLGRMLTSLRGTVRETDFMGWYEERSALGIVFTELGSAEATDVFTALRTKITNALCDGLTPDETGRISMSLHLFPESSEGIQQSGGVDARLYPDLIRDSSFPAKSSKRVIDVAGSLLAMIFFSPFLALIALSIKLTSKGPVVFRQQRVGEDGRSFTFLKFRSMYADNDPAIHEEYVRRLIAGSSAAELGQGAVFKLTKDHRITPLGKFLRKTSLDELPQFLNVLRGEMSLVGPRPPVPYEYECYKVWHRSRLVGVKPGLTGLWQVDGRSRVDFDGMVRLDLKYARTRSLWRDIKILFRTPAAIFTGNGAY
jgi:lipopolysaccharide/colanic/teichoic acid biosynthesis glycosyltransferase